MTCRPGLALRPLLPRFLLGLPNKAAAFGKINHRLIN